jgi:hypothetical protein
MQTKGTCTHPWTLCLAAALATALGSCANDAGCTEGCETDEDCAEGLVCLTNAAGESECAPPACQSCFDMSRACAISIVPLPNGTGGQCLFQGCGP